MRVLGVPIPTPRAAASRVFTDALALERLVRTVPDQLERGIRIGGELVAVGHQLVESGNRLDDRAASFNELGERLDAHAAQLIELGRRIGDVGERVDDTGAEIVDRAGQVVGAAADMIALLPAMERAVDLASPLGGAIDRFGRIVDRFPGGSPPRQRDPVKTPDDQAEEEGEGRSG
jgi:hypothetical protein